MTLTSLLAVLEGSAGDEALLQTVLDLGRERELAVDLLVLRPTKEQMVPLVADGLTGGAIGEIVEALEEQTASRLKASEALYRKLCVEAGLPTVEADEGRRGFQVRYQEVEGRTEEVVASLGRRHDLIAVARPLEAEDRLYAPALEAALFASGRPVLVCPPERPQSLGTKVLVAWNDGQEAARAIAGAMPLLQEASEVDLVVVRDGGCEADPAELKSYLGRHGVTPNLRQIQPDYRPLGEQLLDEAKACEADLLVMGAYGHSRLRELVLGGVTRRVLAIADIPVLMAH